MTSDNRTFDSSFPQLNPNPVIEVDASGKVTFFNSDTQRILESLGMDKGDVDVFLPSDLDAILKDLKNKEEATFYREIPVSDNIFAATVHLVPQFDVVRIYAHDITERKRAEKVMQARLRMAAAAYAVEISVDSLLRLTLDELEALTGSQIGFYHYLEEDQETLSLQNWSTNTVKTMCTAEGSGSHYNISQAGVWVDCVRERRPVVHNDYASLLHRKGMPAGHVPVIREMVVPIMRGDRIVAIIGIGNKKTHYNTTDIEIAQLLGDFSWEIVERKRAEEALRKSEERYRSLFENMLHGFAHCKMLYDEGGHPSDFIYLAVNSAFGKLTGLKNVVGKKVSEAIPGIKEAHPELFNVYGRVALTGQSEKFEIEFKPLELWLSISVYSPAREYFVAIFDDITERRKAEADVIKLSEDMAARNVELEVVNKELESFIYSISHDLRAPIRTMSGFARILVEDCAERLDKLGKDYLVRILRGSKKMTRLIDDLLHLSKISRQEMERTKVDMSKMASSIVAELRESAPDRSVKVNIAEDLTTFADARLTEIVLSNLLGNAWKFTAKTANARIEFGTIKKGEAPAPSPAYRTGSPLPGGDSALLPSREGTTVYYVRDNGAGFNPEYVEKMFLPFHRLHSDNEFEGTGIGLTIVERIVHRHGGKVWAEGEIGKGATIYFTLGHGDKSSP